MENKVSVIMPIYNRGEKVKQAINSVLNQTFKNLELILINDGSTDNTEEICNQYKEQNERIKYFKIENSGPGGARNKGIEVATGKYIMFIDSDDYYEEKMVEIMVASIENSDNECIICNRIINEKDKKIKSDLPEEQMNSKNKQEFIEFLQIKNLFNSVCNKVYLKSIIDEFNIRFDKRFISGEDYKFNLDYFSNINCAKTINEYLYNYVMTPNSIVHSNENYDFFLQVKILDYNVKIYKENNYNVKNIYYKYIIIAIDGISYKIETEKKYKKVKDYIEKIIEYPSIQNILKEKFEKGFEQKTIGFLLRHKMKKVIYLYVYNRNIIKKIKNKIKGNI